MALNSRFANAIKTVNKDGKEYTIVEGMAKANLGRGHKELDEYLSNRYIIIDEFSNDILRRFDDIKDSVIEINRWHMHVSYMHYDEESNTMTEPSELLDFTTKNNTHIIVHTYDVQWSINWCTNGSDLVYKLGNAFLKKGELVNFKCTRRYIEINKELNESVKIDKMLI